MAHMLASLLALASFLPSHAHEEDPRFLNYARWWTSEQTEYDEHEVAVTGALPAWLRGTFYRNGPGLLEMGKRSVSQYFDGLAKPYKFRLSDSKAYYATKFLKSKMYKQWIAKNDVRMKMSLFPLVPPPSYMERMERMITDYSDNTNINIWKTGDHVYATTDGSYCVEIDPISLETKGYGPPIEGVDYGKMGLSAAHPGRTIDGAGTVNYFVNPAQIMGHELEMYVDTPDMKRRVLGSVKVPYLTSIHSFAVTENFVALFYYPMEMDVSKYALGKTDHASGALSWNPALNTTVYIFDLRKTNAPPQVTTTEAFYAMHQINAFEKVDATGNVQLVVDTLAYRDATFMTATETFGSLSIFRDLHKMQNFYLHPSFKPSKPTRITIDLNSGRTSFEPYTIKDEKGTDLACELPRINDRYRGKESCIFYATCGITGDVRALVGKINLCTGKNDLLYTPAEYADEPVFVADPSGTSEDDGVILMTKLDGAKNKTFLHVVDAQSFAERARVYAPIHHTSGIHGAFFPEESHTAALMV
jgi:beta-carotene 15,15'-monooxygenase/beta,beta-carotene 9',10'-dioxygenase